MTGRSLVVAGAGDVGGRLARLRAEAGDEVIALRRSEVHMGHGIRSLQADLISGEGLRKLPRRPDAVVFAASPDERSDAAYRALFVDGPRRILDALAETPTRFLFVSSTAVYGEDAGEWVDEATPPAPARFNGHRLLEAERTLAADCAGSVALRFTGLYGPGREALVRRALSGDPPRPRWTNRIHVDDAAAALSHLLDLVAPAPLYLGSDDMPAREDAVFAWLRQRAGLPPVAVVDEPQSGRRVGNRLLRDSGWSPRFPDFRAGYASVLS